MPLWIFVDTSNATFRSPQEPFFAKLPSRPDGQSFIQLFYDVFARITTFASRMAEATAADAVLNIKNEVVAWPRRHAHRHGIQGERMAGSPGHNVIRTRGVTAHA